MSIHVVMEPPASSGKHASEGAVFIRDRFSWLAFLFPPLWLFWHRLWLEGALALVLMLALGMVGEKTGMTLAAPLLSLLVSLYVGLEGPALRIAALRRAGWREWGVVEADTADDADARYLLDTTETEAAAPAAVVMTPSAVRPAPSGAALGLLSYPGRN